MKIRTMNGKEDFNKEPSIICHVPTTKQTKCSKILRNLRKAKIRLYKALQKCEKIDKSSEHEAENGKLKF